MVRPSRKKADDIEKENYLLAETKKAKLMSDSDLLDGPELGDPSLKIKENVLHESADNINFGLKVTPLPFLESAPLAGLMENPEEPDSEDADEIDEMLGDQAPLSDEKLDLHKIANDMGLSLRIEWERKINELSDKRGSAFTKQEIILFFEAARCEMMSSLSTNNLKMAQLLKDEYVKVASHTSKLSEMIKMVQEINKGSSSIAGRKVDKPETSIQGAGASDRKLLLDLGFTDKELNSALIFNTLKPMITDKLRAYYLKGIATNMKADLYRKMSAKVERVLSGR